MVKDNFVLAEYNAICEKLKTLPNFRFALIALYLGAVGVIVFSQNPDKTNFYGMIGLTVFLWIIDLRTRGLIENIRDRGVKIEKVYWNYENPDITDVLTRSLRLPRRASLFKVQRVQ
ncbi:MAG: hypothetical protein ACFFCW_49600 [Candidatus Hodarchaeota archaeon]